MLSYEITWLLFESEANFNSQNTKECAQVLSMFMIGLIAFGLAKLFLYGCMQKCSKNWQQKYPYIVF